MTDSNFSPALLAIAFIFRLYPQIEDFPTYLSCFCKSPITGSYNFFIIVKSTSVNTLTGIIIQFRVLNAIVAASKGNIF